MDIHMDSIVFTPRFDSVPFGVDMHVGSIANVFAFGMSVSMHIQLVLCRKAQRVQDVLEGRVDSAGVPRWFPRAIECRCPFSDSAGVHMCG